MNRNTLMATGLLALVSGPVVAESATYFGISATTDYVDMGVSQTDGGPALQTYIEHDFGNGLYAGIWMSQVDFSPYGLTDSLEIDPYFGFRGESGKLSYDLYYARYYYDDSGYDSDELALELVYVVTDRLSLGANISTSFHGAFEGEALYGPTVSFGLDDLTTLDTDMHANSLDDTKDWSIGLKRQLTETLSAELRYHDTNYDDGRVSVAFSWDTQIFDN